MDFKDIAEILLKVALNTTKSINQSPESMFYEGFLVLDL
jgi:hypothetical protein